MNHNSEIRVLILGASGLVGGNCLRHFQSEQITTVGTHLTFPDLGTVFYNTLDIDDASNFDVDKYSPTHIVHCGALTNVDYCEDHVDESYLKTVQSTKNVVTMANKCNATVIYTSTDYIYDGEYGPYREDATPHPLNIYGRHKLEAENLIRKNLDRYLILRITNVFGDETRGKNFVSRLIDWSKSQEAKHLEMPFDQFATPVHALDVARIIRLCMLNSIFGTFNFGGNDYYNRYQLAKKVLDYYPSSKIQLNAVTTASARQKALRPLKGGLLSDRLLMLFPDFTFTNIDAYLNKNGI